MYKGRCTAPATVLCTMCTQRIATRTTNILPCCPTTKTLERVDASTLGLDAALYQDDGWSLITCIPCDTACRRSIRFLLHRWSRSRQGCARVIDAASLYMLMVLLMGVADERMRKVECWRSVVGCSRRPLGDGQVGNVVAQVDATHSPSPSPSLASHSLSQVCSPCRYHRRTSNLPTQPMAVV